MMLTERKTKLRLDIGINHLFQANTHFCTNSFGGGNVLIIQIQKRTQTQLSYLCIKYEARTVILA